MRLFADYHTHTFYSHGSGSVCDNALAAQARGLSQVAIADHGPASLFGVGVASLNTFEHIRKDVDQANAQLPGLQVLLAVEANVVGKDGLLDIPPAMQRDFDLILAGLHIMVRPHAWWDALKVGLGNMSEKSALVVNTDLLVSAVYRNRIAIVTHPGLRLPIDTAELARACAATGTALEINTGHRHTGLRYVELVAQEGARLAIGSDAHTPERVGDLQYGLDLVERAGLQAEQVLSAMDDSV